jgi:hypothetical protein
MLGSAAFRTGVAPGGALAGPWVRNPLWTAARAVPSLDLRFAENKSLVDATTGSNLVTFTRASSGTFVGSDGLIKTATTNLFVRSEEFGTGWTLQNVTLSENTIAAPNGTITADTVTDATAGSNQNHRIHQTTISATGGQVYTASFYVKNINATWIHIRDGSNTASCWFNIADKTIGTNGLSSTAGIQEVGDGWLRLSVTWTPTVTSTSVGIGFASANGTSAYTTSTGGSFYLWGAQLEQSSTVGEYIPTTSTINSAPRFDHNPTTGESLGLLVEEARTNLLVQSEDFSTTWPTNSVNVTITANQASSPDGALTADLIVPTTTNGAHNTRQFTSVTSGTTYTQSVFVKGAGYSVVQIVSSTGFDGSGAIYRNFLLSTGQLSSNGTLSAAITAFPNGWYRLSVTAVATSTQSAGRFNINILPSDEATANYNYTGDAISGIYFWGAQLEAGAFPTSYIPTTTATVTRSADVASISGSNFSSWYRQDEGTLFAEATSNHLHGGTNQFPRIASLSDGTTTTRIDLLYRVLSPYTDAGYSIVDSNVSQAAFDTNRQSNGTRLSVGYQINNFAFAQAGSILSGATDNSGTVPVVNQLSIGRRSGTDLLLTGTIRRLCFWPTRLPNSTLQTVTQ